jgi:hypothetical protein
MRLTNKNGFPEALARAVMNDSYTKGESDYSVTELLKPPQLRALQIKYQKDLVDDVEDRLWSLYGQIAHFVLERANVEDLSEKRFYAEFRGKTVSGQIDSFSMDGSILTDWKFVTAWKFKNGRATDEDWISQLNMQAELLRRNGITVSRAQIVGLLRDWSKIEAADNADYPQKGVVTAEIPLWSSEQVTAFINERIALHEAAALAPDDQLTPCSHTERYAEPNIWAVMKGKKAINWGKCLTEDDAKKKHAINPGTRIEFRPGRSKRCLFYCSVKEHCQQYRGMKK